MRPRHETGDGSDQESYSERRERDEWNPGHFRATGVEDGALGVLGIVVDGDGRTRSALRDERLRRGLVISEFSVAIVEADASSFVLDPGH